MIDIPGTSCLPAAFSFRFDEVLVFTFFSPAILLATWDISHFQMKIICENARISVCDGL